MTGLGVLSLGGCGGVVNNDGRMFQRWAQQVAEIRVSPDDPGARVEQAAAASAAPSQPARPLSIAIVDPLDMPNAKAAGLRAAIAAVDRVSLSASDHAGLRSAMQAAVPMVEAALDAPRPGRTVQIASFMDEAAARRAWASLVAADPEAFRGLEPRYERADLGARGVWIRLKVGPVLAASQADRVCRAAGVADGWCARA